MASQTEQAGQLPPPQPGLADVLAAIANCQTSITALTTKVDVVQLDVGLIRQDMDKIRSRLTTTEQRLGHVEDTVENYGADLHALHTKIRALEYKSEDAENRNRRNNLCIVGIAEGADGQRPTEFVEELLRTLLPSAHFSPFSMLLRGPTTSHPSRAPRVYHLAHSSSNS